MSRTALVAAVLVVAAISLLLLRRNRGTAPETAQVDETSAVLDSASGPVLQRTENGLVFEAEAVTTVSGTWELRAARGSAQGAHLFVGEGTGRNNDDIYSSPRQDFIGRAEYEIEIPADGVYVVWGLCWSGDQCSNSCWVGFDRETPVYFPEGLKGADDYIWNEDRYRKWLWLKLPPVRLKAGKRRMRVEVREDGFLIDQWALLPPGQSPSGRFQANLQPGASSEPWLRVYPRTYIVGAGETVVAAVWLHRGSATKLSGKLTVEVPEGVTATFDTAPIRIDAPRTLRRIDVRLKHDASFPRGEHEYRFAVALDDGRTLNRVIRLSRPFRWEVLAPLPLETSADPQYASDPQFSRVLASPPPARWPLVFRGPDGGKQGWVHTDDLRRWFTPYGFLDFEQGLGRDVDNARAYARTTVHAPKAGKYVIETLSDDEACLWVNGKLVYENPRRKPATDHFEQVPVRLNRGANAIALAVRQGGQYWQQRIRIRNPDGGVSGVR